MIRLTLDDVLYNAAVLGLCRIFDHAGLYYNKIGQSIEFEELNLVNFSEHYFSYLINEHGNDTSYTRLIEMNIESVNDNQELKRINDQIDFVKEKLTSNSYKNTYPFLKDLSYDFIAAAKKLKKIRLKKNETVDDVKAEIIEMSEILSEIVFYLRNPQAKRYLVPRILSYNIIQSFWNGVSILDKNAHKKDIYKTYDKYFTDTALEFLEKKKVKEKYEKNKFYCATCENKVGREAYNLAWLQGVGVDVQRKSSHFWDHLRDILICPVCNLVYSCIPFGFRIVKGKGFFINNNRSIDKLISINSVPLSDGRQEITSDDLESMAYYKIIDFMINQSELRKDLEIENIQIVKFNQEKNFSPYSFNILSRRQMKLINECKAEFQHLVGKIVRMNERYISLYQEVVERLYNGQGYHDLLYQLFRLVIDNEYRDVNSIFTVLKISNHQYKGGTHYMTPEELKKIRNYGFHLKTKYDNQQSKINGISHRLSNALKVNNPSKFMETLIQAYGYKNISIPTMFVEILNDREKFQTIGYAFLVGLHGYDSNQRNKEEE